MVVEDRIISGFDVLNEIVGFYVPKRSFVDGKQVKGLEGITELKSRSDASKDNIKILMTNNSIDKNCRLASSILSQRNCSKREAVQENAALVTYIENSRIILWSS
jgi:hypothetical protein